VDASGVPHISYLDELNADLRYARFTGRNWLKMTVDSVGNVGRGAIAVDANGVPHISYLDWTRYDLKHASWNGTSWNISTPDAPGEVGRYSTIAIDPSGRPHVAYNSMDWPSSGLKYWSP